MKYDIIAKATFIERENRFVARVCLAEATAVLPSASLDSPQAPQLTRKHEEIRVHVKNTGRCKELLVPGATVYLHDHIGNMGSRKYRYDLVAVEKGDILINMDSQAPNKVVKEALETGHPLLSEITRRYPAAPGEPRTAPAAPGELRTAPTTGRDLRPARINIRPETTYGSSRFDFYLEEMQPESAEGCRRQDPGRPFHRAFIEVKGVTLEDKGIARFPDAPTERGVRHIQELIAATEDGYDAHIVFVIQMKGIRFLEPNDETHPEFGEALRRAKATGVGIHAYDCIVTEDTLKLHRPVPVKLTV